MATEDFLGRTSEMEEIFRHAHSENENQAMLILAAPACGLSELLRQVYDRLFYEQGDIIPIYFAFSKNENSAEQIATRFLQTLLSQAVAFRRGDKGLIDSAPDICEISELAVPADCYWIDRLVSACESNSRLKDERSFVRQAFSAPLRAKAREANLFVMFDNFQAIENIGGDINLLDEIKEIYQRASMPFVFAGYRRHLLYAIQSGQTKLQNVEKLRLDSLNNSSAALLTEHLAHKLEVKINPQTSDLMIQQFAGNPTLINSIFVSAQESKLDLDSFQNVQQVYVDSVLGKRICNYYQTIFDEIAPNQEVRNRIIDLLANVETKTPMEIWRKRLNLAEKEFRRVVNLLNFYEIVRLNSGMIEFSRENESLGDYVRSTYRLEIVGENRALVVGNLLAESLKRSPEIMARFYRRSMAIGLREILSVFNCQKVPASLLDYSKFKEHLKGEEEAEIGEVLAKETQEISLPHIVYTANCVAFYPPINQFLDEQRSAVGIGFEGGNYTDETEIVWIAAEFDSKLEANRELTEFWCDRLEMVALMCNFTNYQLWLITPEGFTPEALEILQNRHAYGSSRRQFGLLVKKLKAEKLVKNKLNVNEYEMIVPMGDDTEMIAAHALEEIARRHNVLPRSINQIKTALVEACINASEHSLSPDRKIYQKFTVENDKIIITISNRGVKIPTNKMAESTKEIDPGEGRRGWGLKLMRNLMDEVKFEQVDDGTRISMVKYLNQKK